MAEKVIVKSTNDLNGAQFENAATEATLKRLVDLIEKQKPGSGNAVKDAAKKAKDQGIDPKIVKEANDSFSQVGNANKKAVSDLNNSAKDTNSAFSKINNSTKIAGANLEKSSNESSGIFGKMGGMAAKAASGIGGLAVDLVKFAASGPLALLGTGIGLLTSSITDSMKALEATGSVGAGFNGSLLELNKAAASAGMNLNDYSAFVKQNAQVMANLGGTATDGAKRMGMLAKDLRNSEVGQQMAAMGISAGSMNNAMADYITMQAQSGKLQGKNNKELTQGAGDYLKNLSELSKLTGQSVDELSKGIEAQQRDERVAALTLDMSTEAATKFKEQMTKLAAVSPGLADAFKDGMIGLGNNPVWNQLKSISPELDNLAQDFKKGNINQDQFNEALSKLGPEMQAKLKDMNAAGRIGNEEFAKMGVILGQLNQNSNLYSKEAQERAKKEAAISEPFTKAIMNLNSAFDSLWSDIKMAFLQNSTFKKIGDGMGWVAEKIMSFKDPLSSFIKGFDPDKALGGILPKMTDGFMGFINKMTPTLGNIGSNVLDTVKGMMPSVEKTFNNVLGSVGRLGTSIIDSVSGLNFGELGNTVKDLGSSAFNAASGMLPSIENMFKKIIDTFGGMGNSIINMFSKLNLDKIVTTVGKLGSSLFDAFSGMLPSFQNMFDKIFGAIGRIGSKIIDMFSGAGTEGVFKKIIDMAGNLGTTIMNVVSNLTPVFEKIVNVVLKIGSSIIDIVSSIIPKVEKAFNSIVGIIVPYITALGNFWNSAFSGLNIDGMAKSIKNNFVGVIQIFQDVIDNFIGPIFQTINQNLVKIGPKIGPIFSDLVEIVSDVVGIIGNIIGAVASVLIPILRPVGQFLIDAFTPLVDLFGVITSAVKGIVKLLKGDFDGFASAMSDTLGGFINYFTSTLGLIVRTMGNILTPFKEAFDDIADMIETFPLYIKKAVSSILPDWVSSKLGLETSDDIDKKLAARKKQMDEAKVAKASDKKDEPKKEDTKTAAATTATTDQKLASLAPDLAKAVKEASDPSKMSPAQKDQAVGVSGLNDELKATIKALDPSGKMSNEQLLKAFVDSKGGPAGLSNDSFAQLTQTIAQLNQSVKTPATSTPQPPRDYNQVRWEAEAKQMNSSNGGQKEVEVAGDRAVAAAKAADEAKEAAANQVATLNTVSDGIGKLSGIMMAILDLQLQQVEAQKDLVNAAKGRYNVTS
jgi:hypothetical protein